MAEKSTSIEEYLKSDAREVRVGTLRAMASDHQSYLPLSLAEDLMALDLDVTEKAEIIDAAGSVDNVALEDFLTRYLTEWPQDIATRALRSWTLRTQHLLWHRLLPLAGAQNVPQRVRYTVVDNCWYSGGEKILAGCVDSEGLEELSTTFHALMLERSLQWNFEHDRITKIAAETVATMHQQPYPDAKVLPAALSYLARFQPNELKSLSQKFTTTSCWSDLVRLMVREVKQAEKHAEKLHKLLGKPPKTGVPAKLWEHWPAVWQRHHITAETLVNLFNVVHGLKDGGDFQTWTFAAGVEQRTWLEALRGIEDEAVFLMTLNIALGFVDLPEPPELIDILRDRMQTTSNPAAVMEALPLRMRLRLTGNEADTKSTFARVRREEGQFLNGEATTPQQTFRDFPEAPQPVNDAVPVISEKPAEREQRKKFFDLAYNSNTNVAVGDDATFWGLLCQSWLKPTEKKLSALAERARRQPGVFRLCYINSLGRFQGIDQAALKLLDYIRSDQQDILRAVIGALGGIDTPRANQELIAAITRPNVSQSLQLEICNILREKDVGNLQKELRSAMNDLNLNPDVEDGTWELRDGLANLLQVNEAVGAQESTPQTKTVTSVPGEADLNNMLNGRIPNFRQLSSEVKRALRTSQFFHNQVMESSGVDSIDLSPVIDMQYKALELLFRELFEDPATRLIHAGVLQRKLDVIGYARPVPSAMDDFENHVSSLPIIKTIPFFSKFKLRKMLRAICQFRPGKRFTLDGLKAFGLFFLCFGRSECRYGLQGLFELGFPSDGELYDFVKTLHVMQDFRNRAAHEGFHPDASNDIDGIWQSTAEIVQNAFKVKAAMGGAHRQPSPQQARRQQSEPIIEKKVS